MEERVAYARVTIDNILFATDFSSRSQAALPYALSMARKYGSKIFAVHVISVARDPSAVPIEGWQEIGAQALRKAREEMSHLEDQWKGIPHEAIFRNGDVWNELSAIVAEKEISLIVVGTRGRAGVSKLLMGSVAEKIFRQAACPVLTVGPNVSGEPESIADLHTILFPTDFSKESLAAAPYAISLAQENQAHLYLLHVTENPVDKLTENSLKTQLLDLVPPEAELWCEPKAFLDSGPAPEKVLEMADELAADLIVLGVKKAGRLPAATSHLPMATAYKIVTRSLSPVLTVHG